MNSRTFDEATRIGLEPTTPSVTGWCSNQLSYRAILEQLLLLLNGAADEARTRYLHLGKVALYQMSYGRISIVARRAFPATSIIIPQLSPLVNYKFAFFEKRDVSVSPLRTKLRRRSSLLYLTRRKFNCFPFLISL